MCTEQLRGVSHLPPPPPPQVCQAGCGWWVQCPYWTNQHPVVLRCGPRCHREGGEAVVPADQRDAQALPGTHTHTHTHTHTIDCVLRPYVNMDEAGFMTYAANRGRIRHFGYAFGKLYCGPSLYTVYEMRTHTHTHTHTIPLLLFCLPLAGARVCCYFFYLFFSSTIF